MFQLSQTHNQSFQAKAEADFVCDVMRYLRENHAETIVKLPNGEFTVAKLLQEILRKMVVSGIAKARDYKISEKNELLKFCLVMFEKSPNFDKHGIINGILIDDWITPNRKITIIHQVISNNVWEEIRNDFERTNWGIIL